MARCTAAFAAQLRRSADESVDSEGAGNLGEVGVKRMSRRCLRWSIIVSLGVFVLVAAVWGWVRSLQSSAEQYAVEAVREVGSGWRAESLSRRASAKLLATTSVAALDRYLAFVHSQLGSLVEVRHARATGGSVGLGSVVLTVRVSTRFEKGEAVVSWLLLREGGMWRVSSVTFDSDQIRLPGK